MNEKQQTAVQWLEETLLVSKAFEHPDTDRGFEQRFILGLIVDQAIEMERKQIETAYNQGIEATYQFHYGDGKQYYTDTYKTEP